METARVPVKVLILSCTMLLVSELSLFILPGSGLARLGVMRLIQTGLLVLIVKVSTGGWAALGLGNGLWRTGLKTGLIWSAVFALMAAVGGAVLIKWGPSPWGLLRANFPRDTYHLVLFFLVGGLVAPIAEEVFFRGVIYGFFRRWGIAAALILSSLVFVLAHAPFNQIPVTQTVGGLVFATAYERSRSLLAPIIIHVLGNSAIFAISFFHVRGLLPT